MNALELQQRAVDAFHSLIARLGLDHVSNLLARDAFLAGYDAGHRAGRGSE